VNALCSAKPRSQLTSADLRQAREHERLSPLPPNLIHLCREARALLLEPPLDRPRRRPQPERHARERRLAHRQFLPDGRVRSAGVVDEPAGSAGKELARVLVKAGVKGADRDEAKRLAAGPIARSR
jgi:hypothetical protein